MNNSTITVLLVLLILGGLVYFSQNKTSSAERRIDSSIEKVEDAAEDTVDKLGDAADRAIKKVN